jgi:hypothetical protein
VASLSEQPSPYRRVAVILSGDGMSHSEWLEKAGQYEIPKATFSRKIKEAESLELVENDKGTPFPEHRKSSPKGLVY